VTTRRKPPQGAIPFSHLFFDKNGAPTAGGRRSAELALRDPTTPPNLRAELQKYLVNPMAAVLQDQSELLARVMAYRGGRTGGEDRDDETVRRAQIRALGEKHPTLTSRALYLHADAKAIRDEVKERRFANLLSEESPRRKRRVK
jgi:hypothetical protein